MATTFDPNELIQRDSASNAADIPTAIFIVCGICNFSYICYQENIEGFVGTRDPLVVMSGLKELLRYVY